jgi:formylglycine-generating enzyme required for sulfatase activity
MVRDDFWLAVSRFLRDLEVRLLEGHNSALVDLFDLDHARRVLKAFGRAFGKLPDDAAPLPQPAASARADASPAPAQPLDPSANHEAFVEQAVAGLAQEEKVISVRLSLFAEMMKGKPWTPASLKAMGGTEGVGVTFLEETFSAAGAPPEHRYHQTAARTVLKSLLPEAGTDIKGHMRSRDDLLATSGYATRPKDFDDLLRLLDAEVRLISPTDPEGKTNPDGSVHDSASSLPARVRHYQLTHDYLVPSLREWLTRKQRETRKGRAELLLADRAAVWTARPENRQLPTLWQWCELQWWTESKHWTPSQQRMMRRATGHHARRGLLFGALLMIGLLAGWSIRERVVDQRNRTHAEGLVRALLNADTAQVPALLGELSEYRRWADPLLRDELLESIPGTREELHVRLALLPVYASHTDRLADRLLDGAPHEVPVLVNALAPHAESLSGRLWGAVEKPIPGRESRRLRAGAALAKYAPENPRWTAAGELIATDLVRENPVFLGQWTEAFRPVKGRLIPKLSAIFDDRHAERGAERSLATNVLADYASDRPDTLAELLATADESQFAVLFPKLQAVTDQGVPRLMAILEQSAEAGASEEDKERSAKRQANAAAALLRLNLPDRIWPLLKHNPDPRVRSYLIHRFAPLGADPEALLRRLENETDATIQKAICLSLGEYDAKSLSSEFLQRAISKLRGLFTSERDAGLHAAVQWLLSVWGDGDWLKETIDSLARDEANRARFFEKLPGSQNVASDPASTRMPPVWFVNSVGQTMVVVRGPVTFDMGSPETERNRGIDEVKESITLAGCFALASTSVTKEQFLEFKADFRYVEMFRYPEPTCPIGGVNWYLAAAYCNWLSQREGIPEDQWCYVLREGRAWYAKDHLSRTGYRLPTQAEREYATRAGTATAWSFGNSDTLLQKYGWCYENTAGGHTRTVAILKPNEFGFFDMHGNIFNWCDDKYSDAPANVAASSPTPSDVDKDEVLRTDKIMIRGGAFGSRSMFLRSAYRFSHLPTYEYGDIGLRVARTLRGSP